MAPSQMMAAPQMGLVPRRGLSHECSSSVAPATSSSLFGAQQMCYWLWTP